jgi:hypothetical protein
MKWLPSCLLVSTSLFFSSIRLVSAGGVVSNCDEASLRAALAGGGAVTFACEGTITLAASLAITNDTSLDGTGHSVTLSGANLTRLLLVQPGVTLNLQSLTLANGFAPATNGVTGPSGSPGGPGYGGAIYSDNATVHARDCSFRSNNAVGGAGGNSTTAPQSGVGGPAAGGGVYVANGVFTATNCAFALNKALGGTGGGGQFAISTGGSAAGGAVYNLGGTVQLYSCQFSNNSAAGGAGRRFNVTGASFGGAATGGAIYNSTGEVWIVRSTLAGNTDLSGATIGSAGGAIYQAGGNLRIIESSLKTNIVTGGPQIFDGAGHGFSGAPAWGGGVYLAAGTLSLSNSTLAGNKALGGAVSSDFTTAGFGFGGGIYSLATVQAANSTLVGNLARGGAPKFNNPGPSSAFGGGINNAGGSLSLDYVTLNGNAAAIGAGAQVTNSAALGGNLFSTNGAATVQSSILANAPSGSNAFAILTDAGYNLSSDGSCSFSGPGSLNNVDPKLGPLADYGGPTPTAPLLAGSPAIDGGDNSSCLPTDQRGRARPYGAGCDIGAFESSAPFVIRGNVSGFTLKDEVSVTNGAAGVQTLAGNYSLEGLAAGAYTVTPGHSNYLFLPGNQLASVGPDRLGVDFKAYHWNTLSLEGITNGLLHLIFAQTNGSGSQLQSSLNLFTWDVVTNSPISETKYLELYVPVTGSRYYRMVTVVP